MGEDRVTLSALKVVLHILKNDALVESSVDTMLTKDIKRRILTYLDGKYSDVETAELMDLASFLDPRFITDYISNPDLPIVKDRLIREGSEILESSSDAMDSRRTESTETNEDENDDDAGCSTKRRKLSSWLKSSKQASPTDTVTTEEKIIREVTAYEKLPRADVELDPLNWWHVHASSYPVLAVLAKKYLCIPASSCASERVFSMSGHIVSKKRSCLKPYKVNMLVFLAQNL